MAYVRKKGSASASPEKIGTYKGGAKAEKLPYSGGTPTISTLTKKKQSSGAKTGFTRTATNRNTGEKTTSSGTLKRVTKKEYDSPSGRMRKTKSLLSK